ncbi:MAG TPA: TetR/AcrR family transcriptional regulator [Polyangiaceae bacterium]|jgi:AcrR family transcriptional regulator|nr:TetR/AcrR family transcriptional regulator [Polyangiaceae bacterium]
MKPPEIEPAPKRGQYDRALSRRERQAVQRERVITALAALSMTQKELSIANVVELAGIGRNTFYEYFDDIDHALAAIKTRALRELAKGLDSSVQAARTPLERIRALARAWSENLFSDPPLVRLALQAQPEVVDAAQLSGLGQYLESVLGAQHEARSALPGLADALKVRAVAAVFDAVSRAHFGPHPMSLEELQSVLADLSLRLLR